MVGRGGWGGIWVLSVITAVSATLAGFVSSAGLSVLSWVCVTVRGASASAPTPCPAGAAVEHAVLHAHPEAGGAPEQRGVLRLLTRLSAPRHRLLRHLRHHVGPLHGGAAEDAAVRSWGGEGGHGNGVERCQGGFGGAEQGLGLGLSVFFPPQPRPPALGAGLQQRRPHQLPAVGLLLPRGPLPGHGGGRQVS